MFADADDIGALDGFFDLAMLQSEKNGHHLARFLSVFLIQFKSTIKNKHRE